MRTLLVFFAAGFFFALPAIAQNSAANGVKVAQASGDIKPQNQSKDIGDQRSRFINYRPPLRGTPEDRIGGSTRGKGEQLSLAVLVPAMSD